MQTAADQCLVMRTAAWVWVVFVVSLMLVDSVIYAGGPASPFLWYHAANGLPAFVFLGLAYSKWLRVRHQQTCLLMVLLISGAPILVSHLLGLRLPPAPLSNLEGMVLRQLPVLFIGLVLVAWHYRLGTMVAYSVGTNLFELAIVFAFEGLDDPRLTVFYFITVIRTVCFVVVGIFINQLITHLRAQQASLQSANDQLSHYASTLETLTVSRERNRMSRELHDTVVHALSGLSVQLETAKAYWDVDSETARRLLDQSLSATRSGLQETRRALKALRASPLDDLGLALAIRSVAETAAERAGLILALSLPDQSLSLPPDVEHCAYRIAQEAVENVVHHAGAKHLTVRLAVDKAGIELVVQDDGTGFSPGILPTPGHYGLSGMNERAQLAGGTLVVASAPGRGTTVRLVIKGSEQ